MKAKCVKCGDVDESEVEMYHSPLNSFRHVGCGENVTFEYVHQGSGGEVMKIKAGAHIDLNVARAIGLERAATLFRPSTDLNAAFAAADKVGLFDEWLLGKAGDLWYFEDYSERCMEGVQEKTPALAICAAILKLKGMFPCGRFPQEIQKRGCDYCGEWAKVTVQTENS